jgi:hypothetical protein
VPKLIVWDVDKDTAPAAAPEVGIVFTPQVPELLTDEKAAILLAKYENEFLEGTAEEVAKMKGPTGQPYRGTPNPNFGKLKHPYFKLVQDDAADAAKTDTAAATPAPSASSSSSVPVPSSPQVKP